MSFLFLGSPFPGDTVGSDFMACGCAVADGDVAVTIRCLLYDQNNNYITGKTKSFTADAAIAWGVPLTIAEDYPNCTLRVEMWPDGGDPNAPPSTDAHDGINVLGGGHGVT